MIGSDVQFPTVGNHGNRPMEVRAVYPATMAGIALNSFSMGKFITILPAAGDDTNLRIDAVEESLRA
jgi:hypothetical protein